MSDSESFDIINEQSVSEDAFDDNNDSEASDDEYNPFPNGAANKYQDEIDKEIEDNLAEEDEQEQKAKKARGVRTAKPTKAKPKQTQPKAKNIKAQAITLDLEDEKAKVVVPKLAEFSKSPCVNAIKWLLEFAHKDIVKPKHNIRDNKSIDVENITHEEFNDKQFMTNLYNKFVASYKIKQAFRNNLDKGTISKNKEGSLCLKNGKNVVMSTSEQDNKAIAEFDKLIKDIHYNINFSKIKDSKDANDTDLSLLLEFIKLDINKTSNAYNLVSKYKNIIDFEGFGFIYSDVPYKEDEPSKAEVVSNYHELFTSVIYSHPSQVFIRRNGIIKDNDLFDMQFIKTAVGNTLGNIKKSENDTDLLRTLTDMFKTKQYLDIIFKCFAPNNILNKVMTRLFETKSFKELLDDELSEVCFLFSPYTFYCDEFDKLITEKKGSKQPIVNSTLLNRRKAMCLIMSSDDKFVSKSNNYWTGVLSDEQVIVNNWFKTDTDEEKEAKKKEKQTTKKQPKQTKKKEKQSEDVDDEHLESVSSVKSTSSKKSSSSRGKPRKALSSDEEDI